jgi:hypothetical protein
MLVLLARLCKFSRLALRLRLAVDNGGGTRSDCGRLVVLTGCEVLLLLSTDIALATGLGRAGDGRPVAE